MKKLIFLLILSGCSSSNQALPQIKDVYVNWDWNPSLQTCPENAEDVPVPVIESNDPHAASKIATYIIKEQQFASQETMVANICRETLTEAVTAYKNSNK